MKNIFLSLSIIGFVFSISAQDVHQAHSHETTSATKLQWEENYEQARKIAKRQKKPLLLFFTGSDWCAPCKMLNADFFQSDEFIALANEHLILYEADFPRRIDLITPERKRQNQKLKSKYSVSGYPTIIVLNSRGREIGREGYTLLRETDRQFALVRKAIKQQR